MMVAGNFKEASVSGQASFKNRILRKFAGKCATHLAIAIFVIGYRANVAL